MEYMLFLFPVLVSYDWHIALYEFKVWYMYKLQNVYYL